MPTFSLYSIDWYSLYYNATHYSNLNVEDQNIAYALTISISRKN